MMKVTWIERADGASALIDGQHSGIGYQRIRTASGIQSQIFEHGVHVYRVDGGDSAARRWIREYIERGRKLTQMGSRYLA